MEYKHSTFLPSRMIPQKTDALIHSVAPLSFLVDQGKEEEEIMKSCLMFLFPFWGDSSVSMIVDVFTDMYLNVYIHTQRLYYYITGFYIYIGRTECTIYMVQ